MGRFLASLVLADAVLLVATGVLGFLVQDERFYPEHFILALFSLILTLLIHALVFTYFSVTGRMISQAVFIGHLDRTPLQRVRSHKRRVLCWVAIGFLSTVPVVAFGALAAREHAWHLWHLLTAGLALILNLLAFYIEYDCVARQSILMRDVLERYDAVRKADR